MKSTILIIAILFVGNTCFSQDSKKPPPLTSKQKADIQKKQEDTWSKLCNDKPYACPSRFKYLIKK